ncbi:MAG: hypothetical protein EON93_04650 [Burkholderiales bacterium]|nr:MAG: hypothetical protein EON93_04650 [Burkholderiales bacterium]
MDRLETDIGWHREQLRLGKAALRDADHPDNPTRAIEVEALTSAILKLERTLAHLEQLKASHN